MVLKSTIALTFAALVLLVALQASADMYPAIADAYISMTAPDANYGFTTHTLVRNIGESSADVLNLERDLLIKFDLSPIPLGAQVQSATLVLWYGNWHFSDPVGRDLTLHMIMEDWAEGTVTFNNKPAIDPDVTSATAVPSVLQVWMEWDVTDDVAYIANHPLENFGWMLMDETLYVGTDVPECVFTAKDWSENPPYLIVDFIPSAVEEATWSSIKALFK
jgi:hypothetical protein